MLFLKRPISDWTDPIAGKPPPTGYAFSQSLSFCPRFARLADLCITLSAEHGHDRYKVNDRAHRVGTISVDAISAGR